MKIRNGFVSNSSSSSFIVLDVYNVGKDIDKYSAVGVLAKNEIRKLKKFGFKETSITHPSHLEHTPHGDQSIWNPLLDKKTKKVAIKNFGYYVSCNQDEVIGWLVKNNIGFMAMVHYCHSFYLFHKNDKHVMVFENFGFEVETYHQDHSWTKIMKEWKLYCGRPPYYRIPISKILKGI